MNKLLRKHGNLPLFHQFYRKMKLTILILTLSILSCFSAETYSQTTKLTISENNSTLLNVLRAIEGQSEFKFFYNEKVDVNMAASVDVTQKSVTDILDKVLSNTSVKYKVLGRQIALYDKDEMEPFVSEQQQKSVSGKVTDSSGGALPGVTVAIKGTTNGCITDANGNFSIANIPENATLQFSFVGMKSQEVVVGGKTTVNVTLAVESIGVDEVIVIGYGTQQKVNVTGAVSTISSKILTDIPKPNTSNMLQGHVNGLQVVQPTASPGRDDPKLQIRGMGSFGASSDPLILVDGIIGSLNNLNSIDVESISVLKDAASAAIYGSRAANGVILVTTKQGKKGECVVEYRGNVGVHTATRLPDFIYDSYEYMTMYNQARARSNKTPYFTQAELDAYKNPTDKAQYPSFNWEEYYFKPATVIDHNLRFSGGNDKTTYSLSMGYLDQDGILPIFNYKRYNAILTLNSQMNKVVSVGTIINMTKKNIDEPRYTNSDIVLDIYRTAPTYTPYLPDGSGRVSIFLSQSGGGNGSAVTDFDPGNYQRTNQSLINAQAYINIIPFKGLVWQVKGAYNYSGEIYKMHTQYIPRYEFIKRTGEADYSLYSESKTGGVSDKYTVSTLPSLYSTLTYDKMIGEDHTIKALAGFEQQSFKTQYLGGSRISFPSPVLTEIDAGSSVGQTLSGTASEWAIRSYFGRVNYDYRSKYLLEANVRYDGSSRIATANRWGVFPAVSAGWRLSKESFIQNKFKWIDNMKLRASLGTLGNQEIGTYPYQDILSITKYPYETELQAGAVVNRLTDKSLRWESTRVFDLGLDLDIYKGLFGMTFDWFNKKTYGILTSQPVPASLGISGPVTNDGELQNTGWEIELRHANKIGDVSYDAYFLMSTFKNKLLKIRTPVTGVNEVGLPYNSYYMYEWIGIFQSQADIDNSPTQSFFPSKPGDLKIKDQNGDGKVNASDRKTIKGKYPDFLYSFGMNVSWKGLRLTAFFQGSQGNKIPLNGWGIDPFLQGTPPTTKFRNAWSTTNPSNTVPAVYEGWDYGGVAAYPSTYYLQDASYLRLKNVSISYTIPKKIADKIRSKGLTVSVSGENLLTFTRFEGADPETLSTTGSTVSGWGRYAQYPQVRIINFGLDVKF